MCTKVYFSFTEEMLSMPRSSLSGGWKMKLLIIRAMLSKPDILLLDEVIYPIQLIIH